MDVAVIYFQYNVNSPRWIRREMERSSEYAVSLEDTYEIWLDVSIVQTHQTEKYVLNIGMSVAINPWLKGRSELKIWTFSLWSSEGQTLVATSSELSSAPCVSDDLGTGEPGPTSKGDVTETDPLSASTW